MGCTEDFIICLHPQEPISFVEWKSVIRSMNVCVIYVYM